MKKTLVLSIIIAGLFIGQVVAAEEFIVSQKNKAFSVSELTIKVGDSVGFKNEDDFHHNIFSLSDTSLFDLGSYEKGKTKSVTFDTAGTVDIECAIHPNMTMKIIVE